MLSAFFSTIIFLIINLGPLYTSYLLVRRFQPHLPNAARWAATGMICICFIILIFMVTAHLHVFDKIVVTVFCLVLAIIVHLTLKRHNALSIELSAIKDWFKWAVGSKGRLLLITLFIVMFISIIRALLMPPLSWDSLVYHLFFAGTWVQQKGMVLFPVPIEMDACTHFPINGEIIAAWAMLPFHSDLIVNLINFPFLLLGGCALYALAREFNLNRKIASLLACLVCFSPMIYSYVTTTYVDNQVFAELICAVLFFFRFLRARQRMDAVLMFLSLGLAIGTKLTALHLTLLMCSFTFFSILWKNRKCQTLLSSIPLILAGLGLMLLIGGSQYIKNWHQAANPLYPYQISIGRHTLFSGSVYLDKVGKERGLGTRHNDVANVRAMFSYSPTNYPRTAGPKFLFFVVVAAASIFFKPPELSKSRYWLLMLLWLIPILLFYTDNSVNSVLSRRFWPNDSSRFLTAPLALVAFSALLQMARRRTLLPIINFLLPLFIISDLFMVNYKFHYQILNYIFWCLSISMIGIFLAIRGSRNFNKSSSRKRLLAIFGGMMILFLTVITFKLQEYKDKTRLSYFKYYTDLHNFPRQFADGWNLCDNPDQPSTIAFTTGPDLNGHNWFFYPLMGGRLQNRVIYASINRKGIFPTHVDRGLSTENDDFNIWMYNLQSQNVDLIFVQKPFPVELEWIERNPELFQLKHQDANFYIYQFLLESRNDNKSN